MVHDDRPIADLSSAESDAGREISPWLVIGGIVLVLVGLLVLAWLVA